MVSNRIFLNSFLLYFVLLVSITFLEAPLPKLLLEWTFSVHYCLDWHNRLPFAVPASCISPWCFILHRTYVFTELPYCSTLKMPCTWQAVGSKHLLTDCSRTNSSSFSYWISTLPHKIFLFQSLNQITFFINYLLCLISPTFWNGISNS